jgi:hypothetical protein
MPFFFVCPLFFVSYGAAEDLSVEDLDRLASCFNTLDSTVLRQLDMPGQPGYILAKHQDDNAGQSP